MKDLIIYCKSFRDDLHRVARLVDSIVRHNRDNIPVVLSVPRDDINDLRRQVPERAVRIIADEDIISESRQAEPGITDSTVSTMPGHLMQQVLKTQIWRAVDCRHYVVIDSDSYFIRDFFRSDFLVDAQIPYTVMHEAKDLLQFAARNKIKKVQNDFVSLRRRFMALFDRDGRVYDFGPTPLVWAAEVWKRLHDEYAVPRRTNIIDMIREYPSEIQWYGESVLAYGPFPVFPTEPLFKVYHYKAQYEESRRMGENDTTLAKNYLGVVMQSNWNRPPKGLLRTPGWFRNLFGQ